jgi:ABC-type glycerol-3-phosphate transport system permease component
MGMEDDTRAFLVLIVNTIALVLLWMISNVLFGIYWGYAFYEYQVSWKNILYYILAAGTLILMIRHIRRKWRGWF